MASSTLRTFAVPALFVVLFCGIVAAFTVSATVTSVAVPSEPGPEPGMDTDCRGPWNGKAITQAELDGVIGEHKAFLARAPAPELKRTSPYEPVMSSSLDPASSPVGNASALPPSVVGKYLPVSEDGRADLCGARITGLSFRNADLRFARFMGARFQNTDLTGVDASWSYWRRAGFRSLTKRGRANLYGADLSGLMAADSDMADWNFEASDLSFASFWRPVLNGATFDSADLARVTFRDATLKDATFYRAKFAHSRIEIRPGQLPVIPSLRDATGLTSLTTLNGGEASLIELREQLKRAGFQYQAQQINFAINNFSDSNSFPGVDSLEYLLTGLPNAYGMKPQRPLLTGFLLVPIFATFYAAAIHGARRGHETGIWLMRDSPKTSPERKMRPILLCRKNCSTWRTALWFSILSAFRIGWKELSVGDWIARVQQTNYRFEATGWVRSVAGLQSLISVYLLALAVAAYFSQ